MSALYHKLRSKISGSAIQHSIIQMSVCQSQNLTQNLQKWTHKKRNDNKKLKNKWWWLECMRSCFWITHATHECERDMFMRGQWFRVRGVYIINSYHTFVVLGDFGPYCMDTLGSFEAVHTALKRFCWIIIMVFMSWTRKLKNVC